MIPFILGMVVIVLTIGALYGMVGYTHGQRLSVCVIDGLKFTLCFSVVLTGLLLGSFMLYKGAVQHGEVVSSTGPERTTHP